MKRILLPREHGAYAQLVFPLVSGLLLGSPGLAAFGLALCVLALFLAYEPGVVLLGVRGARVRQQGEASARRQLVICSVLALVSGVGALVQATSAVRALVLLPTAFAALLLPLLALRRVKTLAGETVVAAALAAMHVPVAAAGGVVGVALWAPAGVWFAGFFLATLAVHAIKARQKQRAAWLRVAAAAAPAAGLVLLAAVMLVAPSLRLLGVVFALPVVAVLLVNAARVHPRSLRKVGWTLVATDVVTLALLLFLR